MTHLKTQMGKKNPFFKNGNLIQGKIKIIKKKIPSCTTEEQWSRQKI